MDDAELESLKDSSHHNALANFVNNSKINHLLVIFEVFDILLLLPTFLFLMHFLFNLLISIIFLIGRFGFSISGSSISFNFVNIAFYGTDFSDNDKYLRHSNLPAVPPEIAA